MRLPFGNDKERLRQEASAWLMKSRGPDAETHRAAFERWYRADPEHQKAYDRIAALYEASGRLAQTQTGRNRSLPEPARRTRASLGYALAAILVGAALIALTLLGNGTPWSPAAAGRDTIFATGPSEGRTVSLADGSRVTLWPRSRLQAILSATDRRMILAYGAARFTVAHERRPFLVVAGPTEILAHGTVFDVRIVSGRTSVTLIEGSVDVTYPASPGRTAPRHVTRLVPGGQLVVDPARGASATLPGRPAATDEPMLQFDNTPLAQAIAQANRHGATRIELADPAAGRLRITGVFRASDNEAFARGLATAFRLRLERRPDGTLILHAAPPAK